MDADSVEVEESDFDMESASQELGEDLFGKREVEEVDDDIELEVDETEEVETKAEETEEKKEPDEPSVDMPASWKKDVQELWDGMTKEQKEQVLLRENQMREGLEKDRADANLGRTMRDIITPYQAVFEKEGVDPAKAVNNMLQLHTALSNGTPEQKQMYLNRLAQSYGIGQSKEGDPNAALMAEIKELREKVNSSHERSLQEARKKVESEVSEFAKDRPYFDDLAGEIAKFIQVGYELEEAYERAVWSNPETRAKENERLLKEEREAREAKAKEEAEKAKKAKSVNVKGRDTRKAPTATKGKFLSDESLSSIYDDIQSRESI